MQKLSTLNSLEKRRLAETDALLFDLDGTLLDSGRDLLASLNHMLVEDGFDALNDPRLFSLVSLGGRTLINHGYGAMGQVIDAKAIETVYYPRFLKTYESRMTDSSSLYPGTCELLQTLQDTGRRILLASNKPEALTRALLGHFNIIDCFEVITGGDTFAFRKPDPRHLTEALKQLGDKVPERPLMVGDGSPDIEAAQAAGIASIAVSFGYSPVPVETLGATAIIDSLDELTQLFQ